MSGELNGVLDNAVKLVNFVKAQPTNLNNFWEF